MRGSESPTNTNKYTVHERKGEHAKTRINNLKPTTSFVSLHHFIYPKLPNFIQFPVSKGLKCLKSTKSEVGVHLWIFGGVGKASAWSLHAIDAATLPAGGFSVGGRCCLGAGFWKNPLGEDWEILRFVKYTYV